MGSGRDLFGFPVRGRGSPPFQGTRASVLDWVFNRHELDRTEDFIAPDAINHNARAGTPDGTEGTRELFTRLCTGFPDMQFDLATMVAEDDKVVCIGTMNGTHDGPFMGMPPTHKHTSARHIHVLTFNTAGQITDHLAVRDDIVLLRQLGRAEGWRHKLTGRLHPATSDQT